MASATRLHVGKRARFGECHRHSRSNSIHYSNKKQPDEPDCFLFGGEGGIRSPSATPELHSWQQVARRRFVSELPPAVLTLSGSNSQFTILHSSPVVNGMSDEGWRRGRDSNPRDPCGPASFQD